MTRFEMEMHYLSNAIGIVGVILVVSAYFLITSRRLTGDDMAYHWLNFIGAWLIMVSLFYNWNLASVVIETVWILISGYGLWRCWLKRRR